MAHKLHHVPLDSSRRALDDVGLPHKPGNIGGFGRIVHLGGGAHLLKPAFPHDSNPVGHIQASSWSWVM